MRKILFSSSEITFSSLPTKFEKDIYILLENKNQQFKVDFLLKRYGISFENLVSNLERLQKKVISFKSDSLYLSGNLISKVLILDSNIIISYNQQFHKTLELKFKFLKNIFQLEKDFSIIFFLNFCLNTNTTFEKIFTIQEFKEILKITTYERFYDFELNVLKKLKEDIEEHTPYLFDYEKIKSGDYKNSKIESIKVIIFKKNYYHNSVTAIKLLERFNFFNNKNTALLTLIELLDLYPQNEVTNALKLFTKKMNIEDHLKGKLLTLTSRNKEFILFYDKTEYFSNILKLQNTLFKEIKKIDSNVLFDEFFTSNLLKKLYQLSKTKELSFENETFKLNILSFSNREYNIKIYSK